MKLTGYENTEMIMKEIGQRIRDTRISSSMTREELASRSGASVSTVTRAESGVNVSFDQIINMMRALGVLSNIDVLIPEYQLSPIDIVNGKKKRQRASTAKRSTASKWKWGDEK